MLNILELGMRHVDNKQSDQLEKRPNHTNVGEDYVGLFVHMRIMSCNLYDFYSCLYLQPQTGADFSAEVSEIQSPVSSEEHSTFNQCFIGADIKTTVGLT